ncbi:MAG: serine dehydratase subunit alpha family protein [Eubacterium sp.]|nr:serine dehydratase subunit alpha family protein [Eubacterium sp.]
MNERIYNAYLFILHRELVPAMGCTEPISVAYAGALAKKALGALPERIELCVSGNIIKNVKSVIVPHTNGRKGLSTAVCAGIVFGDPERELEVLSDVSEEQLKTLDAYLEKTEVSVTRSEARCPFDIQVRVFSGEKSAFVRIIGDHTNVVEIRSGDKTIVSKPYTEELSGLPEEYTLLNIADIVDFAEEAKIADVADILDRQIEYNTAIAEQGLTGKFGAGIGKILLDSYGNAAQNRAKAWAAAGSDARMNGCELPVVINSGSGNQGITASLPVIVYAKELGVTQEKLYRALIVSNLVTIRLKREIGCLSAYCGATSAGAGAGAGISYLYGGGFREVSHTIVNTLAINSGMICDGAKSSCAAKIASAVGAGLLGMYMYINGKEFFGGDGIVVKGVENTIDAVSDLARDGMRETDEEIIRIMLR